MARKLIQLQEKSGKYESTSLASNDLTQKRAQLNMEKYISGG